MSITYSSHLHPKLNKHRYRPIYSKIKSEPATSRWASTPIESTTLSTTPQSTPPPLKTCKRSSPQNFTTTNSVPAEPKTCLSSSVMESSLQMAKHGLVIESNSNPSSRTSKSVIWSPLIVTFGFFSEHCRRRGLRKLIYFPYFFASQWMLTPNSSLENQSIAKPPLYSHSIRETLKPCKPRRNSSKRCIRSRIYFLPSAFL